MFDSVAKFQIEQYPADFAAWLLGEPIALTKLQPTELSIEPIRADSLILLQSDTLVLHCEFQTDPDLTMPFRMADYRLRVYRKYPDKAMKQVVIYLRATGSAEVLKTPSKLAGCIMNLMSLEFGKSQQSYFSPRRGFGLMPFSAKPPTKPEFCVRYQP